MKNSTRFDIGLLEYSAKTKMLKQITFFYMVKAKFKHSIIYNYTPNKLAKLTGLHWKTTDRYVKRLIKEEFCELRDGHLLFKRVNMKRGKKIVETRPYTSFDGMLKRIYTVLLINNKKQQEFRIATNYGINIDKLNPRLKRKALRQADLSRGLGSSKPITSIHGASKIFNTSKVTAQKVLKSLKEHHYIDLKPLIKKHKRMPIKQANGFGYFYNKGNYTYHYLGRELEIGDYIVL